MDLVIDWNDIQSDIKSTYVLIIESDDRIVSIWCGRKYMDKAI